MMLMLAHADGDVFVGFSGWTFILRFGQQLLQLAPHLLFGVILAGLLRTPVGQRWLVGCLDAAWPRSMPRAIVLGLVAPVGALGGLPIASEMMRAGIRPSVVLPFLVTAPLFMPWSFGYAADALGLLNALIVVLGGSLLAFFTGAVARAFEGAPRAMPLRSATPDKSQLFAALRAAANHSSGWLLVYVLIAVTGSAGLAAILEAGSIEAHLGESSVATLFELSVPIALANPEPDVAVLYASEFWRIGLLGGGMFLALYLGAGWSLGTFAWCVHHLRRTGVIVTIAWLFVAMSIATVGNSLLEPVRPGEADSHGLDVLTKPHNFGGSSPMDGVVRQLSRAADGSELALAALGTLFAIGVLGRLRTRTDSAVESNGEPPRKIETDRLSQPAIRATLLGAIVICLMVSVFSYFPSPRELHERLRLQSGNLFEAVSVLNSSRQTPEEKSAAEVRALNALDRIDAALARYPTSRGIHFADPMRASLDAAQLRTESKRLKQLVAEGASEELKRATLDFAGRLSRN
jgi:uncharacterized membrane protein YraQ (UPF0718 family)